MDIMPIHHEWNRNTDPHTIAYWNCVYCGGENTYYTHLLGVCTVGAGKMRHLVIMMMVYDMDTYAISFKMSHMFCGSRRSHASIKYISISDVVDIKCRVCGKKRWLQGEDCENGPRNSPAREFAKEVGIDDLTAAFNQFLETKIPIPAPHPITRLV